MWNVLDFQESPYIDVILRTPELQADVSLNGGYCKLFLSVWPFPTPSWRHAALSSIPTLDTFPMILQGLFYFTSPQIPLWMKWIEEGSCHFSSSLCHLSEGKKMKVFNQRVQSLGSHRGPATGPAVCVETGAPRGRPGFRLSSTGPPPKASLFCTPQWPEPCLIRLTSSVLKMNELRDWLQFCQHFDRDREENGHFGSLFYWTVEKEPQIEQLLAKAQ